jgi:hypothetical protein
MDGALMVAVTKLDIAHGEVACNSELRAAPQTVMRSRLGQMSRATDVPLMRLNANVDAGCPSHR